MGESRAKTVLLVEDNPDDVELTRLALNRNDFGIEIVVAEDGAEALEYMFPSEQRGVARHPAVVLLDLNLPKVSGVDVLKRIRADERTRLQPVVVLTSSLQAQDVIASYSHGANSYIRKPVDFNDFVEAVRQLGLYWLTLNETPPAPTLARPIHATHV